MIWDIALAVMAVIAFTFIGIPVLFMALCLLIGVLFLVVWIIIQPIYFIHDRFFRKEEESDHA